MRLGHLFSILRLHVPQFCATLYIVNVPQFLLFATCFQPYFPKIYNENTYSKGWTIICVQVISSLLLSFYLLLQIYQQAVLLEDEDEGDLETEHKDKVQSVSREIKER